MQDTMQDKARQCKTRTLYSPVKRNICTIFSLCSSIRTFVLYTFLSRVVYREAKNIGTSLCSIECSAVLVCVLRYVL